MSAVVYNGPRGVSVDKVPDAEIQKLTDVVVRLTTTNICGSDSHMCAGRTSLEKGRIFGHENLGEVVESAPSRPGEERRQRLSSVQHRLRLL